MHQVAERHTGWVRPAWDDQSAIWHHLIAMAMRETDSQSSLGLRSNCNGGSPIWNLQQVSRAKFDRLAARHCTNQPVQSYLRIRSDFSPVSANPETSMSTNAPAPPQYRGRYQVRRTGSSDTVRRHRRNSLIAARAVRRQPKRSGSSGAYEPEGTRTDHKQLCFDFRFSPKEPRFRDRRVQKKPHPRHGGPAVRVLGSEN